MSSDDGFRLFIQNTGDILDVEFLIRCAIHFLLGIPVACYIFGVAAGNAFKHYSCFFERSALEKTFVAAHRIPRAALYSILGVLVALYLLYLFTVGINLYFSLTLNRATTFAYADFARQGFFELCWVAVINVCVLITTWIFARRTKEERPVLLRVFTGLITALTCLLIVLAASKMWLYVQAYGLTPLRVYTSWFIALLFIAFLLLLIWHLRPFNVMRPLVVVTIALVLALAYTNTDGLIARYNVDNYLSGQTHEIDTEALARLSDAAVPALRDLSEQTTDPEVRLAAASALSVHAPVNLVAPRCHDALGAMV